MTAESTAIFDFVFRPYALLSLAGIAVNLFLIVLIVSKGLKVAATRWFVFFLSSLVVWGVGEFFGRLAGNPTSSDFWGLLGAFGYVFMAPLFLVFTLNYVNKEDVLKNLFYQFLIFGSALFILFIVWHTNFVIIHDPSQAISVPWGWTGPTGSFFSLFLVWLESQFITSLVLIFKFYFRSKEKIKKQTGFILVALLIPLIGGTITDGLFPILNINVIGTAILLTSVMAIIITYAIVRYNLFVFNPATYVSNIVATMKEALVVFDQSKVIQYVNEAVVDLFGYAKEELVGESVQKLITNETAWNEFETKVTTPLEEGKTINNFETKFKAKVGAEIPVSFSGSPLKEAGKTVAFVGVVADIREIKKLITDVEAERNKLSMALAGIVDGVFVVDKQGKILLLNKACETMLGVSIQEVADKNADELFIFYDGEERFTIRDLFPKETLTEDKVVLSKNGVKVVGPSNKQVFVNLVSSGIAENEEVDLGAIITMHDVSKEVELEEMKLDFVSMAAHELRTPLTSIRGYLSVLQEEVAGKLDKDQKSFLDKAFISSSQLAALVENLLSVSRIERGALKVQAEPASWTPVAQEIYNNFTNLAAEKNIKLSLEVDPELPLVMVDKFRLSEVLSNLVANALQYTKPYGSVSILVKKDKEGVLTQVKDTGQGIPDSAIPKLFTKFFRVSGVLEQGSKGTGLGLYISKAIVDMHGGRIWVDSEMGKGSTFSFIIPYAKNPAKKLEFDTKATDEVKKDVKLANPVKPQKRLFKKQTKKS